MKAKVYERMTKTGTIRQTPKRIGVELCTRPNAPRAYCYDAEGNQTGEIIITSFEVTQRGIDIQGLDDSRRKVAPQEWRCEVGEA